jgi:hypothetical protein
MDRQYRRYCHRKHIDRTIPKTEKNRGFYRVMAYMLHLNPMIFQERFMARCADIRLFVPLEDGGLVATAMDYSLEMDSVFDFDMLRLFFPLNVRFVNVCVFTVKENESGESTIDGVMLLEGYLVSV